VPRAIRSLGKLCCIILRDTLAISGALLRGDITAAGGRTRLLAVSVQDDLVSIIVAVQRLLPLWRLPRRDVDRILIVKLDRLGDMVTTTPVFDALRTLFPRARLDLVAHPTPLALLEGDERLGQRFAYRSWLYHPLPILPAGLTGWGLVLRLLWRRYPLVVYLRGSFPFLLLGLTSRLAATKFIVAEPVITRYMKALEALFGPLPHPEPRLHVSGAALRFAHDLLARADGSSGPSVVIHAAASQAAKIWPAERFAALADQLVESHNARVHFLGTPQERAGLEKIVSLAAHPHAVHCGLRLPQVVALIAAGDLFIGNDSGLAHIAAAVGTRLVVLWGPANLSMARPKARPEDCIILYHDVPCREGCPEIKCVNPNPLECLTRTQVADVVAAARRLLKAPGDNGRQALPVLVSGGSSRS
jgi:ADP-heptose:LPS heptosyltransferase